MADRVWTAEDEARVEEYYRTRQAADWREALKGSHLDCAHCPDLIDRTFGEILKCKGCGEVVCRACYDARLWRPACKPKGE